jgi:transcriptional regulator with XRE-family HTH domain
MNIAEFAAWLRQERRAQKVSQDDLACLVAESYSLISDIERGRRRDPGFITLRRICAALGYELTLTVTRRTR